MIKQILYGTGIAIILIIISAYQAEGITTWAGDQLFLMSFFAFLVISAIVLVAASIIVLICFAAKYLFERIKAVGKPKWVRKKLF